MASVRWTAQAQNDLEAACRYIARYSDTYAESLRLRILSRVADLTSSPRMGRKVPEIDCDDLRELVVHPFRVMYRIVGENVEILRVWHSARNFRSAEFPENNDADCS